MALACCRVNGIGHAQCEIEPTRECCPEADIGGFGLDYLGGPGTPLVEYRESIIGEVAINFAHSQ